MNLNSHGETSTHQVRYGGSFLGRQVREVDRFYLGCLCDERAAACLRTSVRRAANSNLCKKVSYAQSTLVGVVVIFRFRLCCRLWSP